MFEFCRRNIRICTIAPKETDNAVHKTPHNNIAPDALGYTKRGETLSTSLLNRSANPNELEYSVHCAGVIFKHAQGYFILCFYVIFINTVQRFQLLLFLFKTSINIYIYTLQISVSSKLEFRGANIIFEIL